MQLKKILYKNSEQIKKDVVNINGFLEKILHEFDFHQEWDFNDYYNIEIKKSFVRGILRYNYLTDILLKNLHNHHNFVLRLLGLSDNEILNGLFSYCDTMFP